MPTPERPGASVAEPTSLESVSVFVVDDDPGVRAAMARAVKQVGFVVHEFPTGDDALTALRTVQAGVVVTDRLMPGISGLELVERAL